MHWLIKVFKCFKISAEYFILKKNHGMDQIIEKIAQTARFLEEKGFTGASTAIVLGTGLGSFIDRVEVIQQISYNEIPHFPHLRLSRTRENLYLPLSEIKDPDHAGPFSLL